MSNPMKGEVTFVDNGATYTLVFTINALVTLEDELGIATTQIGELLGANVKMKDLRTLFWAGLIEHHEVTQEAAGQLIDGLGMQEAVGLIGKALTLAFPEAAKGTARPRVGAHVAQAKKTLENMAAGTGQNS